ncbi:hypothetical protein C8R47DRAFT_1162940 [Mycena vitilis]|nr:hypothetical protein C8R47DRAFT_1162940 [Mycena vitilis]
MARTCDKAHIHVLIEAKRTKISTLESQIGDLTRLREAAMSELAVLQLMISPIGKLPTELLAEVFHLVVPPEQFSTANHDNTDKIVHAALKVSQVCCYWRRIAHSTPQLWVDGFRVSTSRKPDLDLEQTTAWLERSHPLPITAYFHAIDGPESSRRTEILDLLLSAVRRWRFITWNLPYLLPLCELPPGSLERLERLTIESETFEILPRGLELSAPLLREVVIALEYHATIGPLRLPWSQLTQIGIGTAIFLDDCIPILVQCVNARWIRLFAFGWDLSGAHNPTPVVLPFLSSLEVHVGEQDEDDRRPGGITHFFAYLALPALKYFSLSIGSEMEDIVWDAKEFSEFQDRAPAIEKLVLKLNRCRIGASNLGILLRHSPAITTFVLNGSPIDNVFVRELEVHENDPHVLVPRLVELTLSGIGDLPSDSALEAMIRSRWRPEHDLDAVPGTKSACLKGVVLSRRYREGADSISAELQESLRSLREQGLRLFLR